MQNNQSQELKAVKSLPRICLSNIISTSLFLLLLEFNIMRDDIMIQLH